MTPTLLTRLVILLASDIALTVVNAYIPLELAPIRAIVTGIELIFMTMTMAVAMQYVLEDF